MGWLKSLNVFVSKIKDTYFIFTNKFIELDIFSMLASSCVVGHWLFSFNVSIWLLSTSTDLPDPGTLSSENLQHKTSQTTFDTFSFPVRARKVPRLFFHQVREVFIHYFFQQVLYPLLTLFSSWCPYDVDVVTLDVVPEVP